MSTDNSEENITTLHDVLNTFTELFTREDFDDYDKAQFIIMTGRKLTHTRNRICYCAEGVCCDAHETHSSPHRNCILR